jgi:hypothetical protein
MSGGQLLMMLHFLIRKPEPPSFSSKLVRIVLLLSISCGSVAHASDVACITAGRLDSNGQWAPKFDSVRLLDGLGRAISSSKKDELKNLQVLEIAEPALLSACLGDKPMTPADGSQAQTKSPVPAAKPGRVAVLGVGYPQLRVGGALVEVKVQVTADQIVMLTR